MQKTSKAIAVIALVAAPVLGIVGGSAVAGGLHSISGSSSPNAKRLVSANELPTPNYQKNPKGQTLGTLRESPNPAQDPELVLAVATNGKTGYIYSSELNTPSPVSPAAAAAATKAFQKRTISVFKADGSTKIGDFVIG